MVVPNRNNELSINPSFIWHKNLNFLNAENQHLSFKIFILLPLGLYRSGKPQHSPLPPPNPPPYSYARTCIGIVSSKR